jgi:hypothetical protein
MRFPSIRTNTADYFLRFDCPLTFLAPPPQLQYYVILQDAESHARCATRKVRLSAQTNGCVFLRTFALEAANNCSIASCHVAAPDYTRRHRTRIRRLPVLYRLRAHHCRVKRSDHRKADNVARCWQGSMPRACVIDRLRSSV